MSKHFQTMHPRNGFDVIVEFDEDKRLVGATYTDGEDVELTEVVKIHLQSDIDIFHSDPSDE